MGMGEMHLPTGCWILVALIAAFTVWTCLSMLATVVEYERRRRNLGREVNDLRRRYSWSVPAAVMTPGTKTGSGRKAA